MFVTCDSCHAEYELDDAKIPARGARLRCTSCKHSFVVVPPGGGDLARAEELARAAQSETASRAPEPEPQPAAADDEPGFDGESDWEFNDVVEAPDAGSGSDAFGVEEAAAESGTGWGDLGSAEDVVDDLLGSSGAVDRDAAGAVDDLLGEIDFSAPQPRTAPEFDSAPASAARDLGGREAASAFEALEADLAATAADEFESLADWGDLGEPA
ncbi:MAG TPA: zinc-ribbon domain-containing protein, partial [Myxococcota bacterium]|nr:zinc-ribbon domain-containing protein [Myxococcota bacterium]